MSEYKRLPKQSGWKADMDLTQEMGYSYIYQRLAELENKIEQGTLIEMNMEPPFKIGGTAYWLNGLPNCIQEYKVLGYSVNLWSGVRVDLGDIQPLLFRAMTEKKLFRTREEAEKRLLELQGDKE